MDYTESNRWYYQNKQLINTINVFSAFDNDTLTNAITYYKYDVINKLNSNANATITEAYNLTNITLTAAINSESV